MTSEQLRMIRNALGMTRKQFADRAGLSAVLITKIERGEWKVTRRTAQRVKAAFGITEPDIISLVEFRKKYE